MTTALLVLFGYLVGSLSFAVIVSRFMQLPDPHSYGSGNPGATNVLRTGNKRAAVLTLIGDSLKGLFVVLAVRALAPGQGIDNSQIALAGLGAFLGHLYPLYFGFRGGKGVATAAGVLFGLDLWLGLGVLGVWGAAFAVSRISSVGALAAALAAPVIAFGLVGAGVTLTVVAVMSALLLWRHRENIRKLRAGTEGRVKAESNR
ncbi:MAG: glycerol-3-phosphate 1-O-acyltransferase PlsY [Burkholderiales bacterium]